MDIFLVNQFIYNVLKEQLLQELSNHASQTQWYTGMRCFDSKSAFSPAHWVGAGGPTFDSLTCPADYNAAARP